jgi:tRNA(Arg) A34 adenosine deaminase TadA
MKTHQEFMQEAVDLATENVRNGGGPFGAVIVKDGKIIGRGANRVTHNCDPTAHAEVMAIREACQNVSDFNLEGATLYTSCEPCPMCLSAIYWSRISEAYFGNSREDAANIGFDDSYIYDQVSLDISDRDLKLTRVGQESAIESFKAWDEFTEKTPY